jgi:hypothetical protein
MPFWACTLSYSICEHTFRLSFTDRGISLNSFCILHLFPFTGRWRNGVFLLYCTGVVLVLSDSDLFLHFSFSSFYALTFSYVPSLLLNTCQSFKETVTLDYFLQVFSLISSQSRVFEFWSFRIKDSRRNSTCFWFLTVVNNTSDKLIAGVNERSLRKKFR